MFEAEQLAITRFSGNDGKLRRMYASYMLHLRNNMAQRSMAMDNSELRPMIPSQ